MNTGLVVEDVKSFSAGNPLDVLLMEGLILLVQNREKGAAAPPQSPLIQLIDTTTGNPLASWEDPNKDIERIRMCVLPNKRILTNLNDRWHLLSPLPQGPLLLRSPLSYTPKKSGYHLELPEPEARKFVNAVKDLLSPEEKTKLEAQLPAPPAPDSPFSTACIYINETTASLLSSLTYNLSADSLSCLHIVLELCKNAFGEGAQVHPENLKAEDMNVELNRLKSFLYWPVCERLESVNPHVLSQCGFYYEPKLDKVKQDDGSLVLQGQDRVVNYCCKGALSNWSFLEHPWKELSKLHPNCPFITGKPSNNVPLAYSFASLPPVISPYKHHTTHIATAPHTDILLTMYEDGNVVVWDSLVGLKKLYNFCARKPENPGHGVGLHLVKCEKKKEEKKKQLDNEKWIDWCSNGIEVFVKKGIYNGVKGTVFDVISEDNICVYLDGFGEVVNIPISHLQPFRPTGKQQVKIITKEQKGEIGRILSIQSQNAVIRLESDNSIVSLPMTSFAPLANTAIETEDIKAIEDCCCISVWHQDKLTSINIYQVGSMSCKYLQCLENTDGEAVSSVYMEEITKLFVLYQTTEEQKPTAHLVSFDFQPNAKRISLDKKISISFRDPSDRPASLTALTITAVSSVGGKLITVLSSKGELVIVDPIKAEEVSRVALEEGEEYLKLLVLPEDEQVRCLTKSGKIISFFIGSKQEDLETVQKVDLGEVSEENLKLLTAPLSLHELKHRELSTSNCKQITLDNDHISWRLSQTEKEATYTFSIDFPSRRFVDNISVQLGFLLPWINDNQIDIMQESRDSYNLSVKIPKYVDGKISGLETVVDEFNLLRVAKDSTKKNKRNRNTSLHVNLHTKSLELTVRYIPRKTADNSERAPLHEFIYEKDFDKNGLLYWLGTDCNNAPYQNPSTNGKVVLTLSHDKLYSPEMKKETAIAHNGAISTYWGGSVPQWFAVDIGANFALRCSHYTLRHGYQHANSYLQNWEFQGSHNGKTWVKLHEGGTTPFTKGFDTKTFPVQDNGSYYRYFRVVQNGNYSLGVGNLDKGSPYICISGFELYGELNVPGSVTSSNTLQSLSFAFSSLNHDEGNTKVSNVQEIRSKKSSFYLSTDYQTSLLTHCENPKTPNTLRLLCLQGLMEIITQSSQPLQHIIQAIHWKQFLRACIISAPETVAELATSLIYKLLIVFTDDKELLNALQIALLEEFEAGSDTIQTAQVLENLISLVRICAPLNVQATRDSIIRILLKVGKRLYEQRAPAYNILRTYFGLDGLPLEISLFSPPKVKAQSDVSENPASATLKTSMKLTASSGKTALRKSNQPKTNDLQLDQKIELYQHDFGINRQDLLRVLESINLGVIEKAHQSTISEEDAKKVNDLYTKCLEIQSLFHSTWVKLKSMEDYDITSCDLDRCSAIATQLFSLWEKIPHDEKKRELENAYELFQYYAVFGTKSQKNEIVNFFNSKDISRNCILPSRILTQFFSSRVEPSQPQNLFSQDLVFGVVSKLFHSEQPNAQIYFDDLFSLLSTLLSASSTNSHTLSWTLLLLTNLLSPKKQATKEVEGTLESNLSALRKSIPDVTEVQSSDSETALLEEKPKDDATKTKDSPTLNKKNKSPFQFSQSHLRTLFSLLVKTSSLQNDFHPEPFFLSIRLLEVLSKSFTPQAIVETVFLNADFEVLLENTCRFPISLMRSSVLSLVEKLRKKAKKDTQNEDQFAEKLRNLTLKVLVKHETNNTGRNVDFLLELLLVICPTPRSISAVLATEKNVNLAAFLIKLASHTPLLTLPSGRMWCIILRLLIMLDLSTLKADSHLDQVLGTALSASFDIQDLVLEDFTTFIHKLQSVNNVEELSKFSELTINKLINTFVQVCSEGNYGVYLALINTKWINLNAQSIGSLTTLLNTVSAELPQSNLAAPKHLNFLTEVFSALKKILKNPQFSEENCKSLLTHSTGREMFSSKFINWLGHNTSNSNDNTQTDPNPFEKFRKRVMGTILAISRFNYGAKHFLKLCSDVLVAKPNTILSDLCKRIITNEELAFYFAVELSGYKFLVEHLSLSSHSNWTKFATQTVIPMLSTQEKKKSTSKNLEVLKKIILLEPKNDAKLKRLIRDSAVVTTASSPVWTHNFEDSDTFSITLVVPIEFIVKEIRIDSVLNYNLTSKFPSSVVIHTGMSQARLLPVGRFTCRTSSVESSPTIYKSFKFSLPEYDSLRYIRLDIRSPKFDETTKPNSTNTNTIAINRIQLLGYTDIIGFFSHNNNLEQKIPTPSNIPVSSLASLLETSLSHGLVQERIIQSIPSEVASFAFTLTHLLVNTTPQTNTILSILTHLSTKHPSLCNTLLNNLLRIPTKDNVHEIPSSISPMNRADLTSRLCCILDEETSKRFQLFMEFVFKELSSVAQSQMSSNSSNNQIVPFLNAFSTSLRFFTKKNLEMKIVNPQEQEEGEGKKEEKGFLIPLKPSDLHLLFQVAKKFGEGNPIWNAILAVLGDLLRFGGRPLTKEIINVSLGSKLELSDSSSLDNCLDTLKMIGKLGVISDSCVAEILSSPVSSWIVDYLKQYITGKIDVKVTKVMETLLQFLSDIGQETAGKSWIGKELFDILFQLANKKQNRGSIPFAYLIQDALKNSLNLNTDNQSRIANFLLEQLRSGQGKPEFHTLQTTVDMLSFQNSVVVNLLDIHGNPFQVETAPTHKAQPPIRLDPKYCSPSLEIDNDGFTVSANAKISNSWRTVLATKPLLPGEKRSWEVVIDSCPTASNIMIGICERKQILSTFIGQSTSAQGWSYYGAEPGYINHNGNSEQDYGQGMYQGDVIGVHVDMEQGTLSFTHNGEDFGIAFNNIPTNLDLYPAVSLYDANDKVTFREQNATFVPKKSLSDFRITSSSPFYYHNNGTIIQMPGYATLAHLKTLVHQGKEDGPTKNIAFHLAPSQKSPLNLELSLTQCHQQTSSRTPLLDIYVDTSASTPSLNSNEAPKHSPADSLFLRFADLGGLSLLVEVLIGHYESIEKKSSESGTETWYDWLKLLRSLLSIPSYSQAFVSSQTCTNLLFSVISDTVQNPTNPTMTHLTTPIEDKLEQLSIIPSTISHPLQPLLDTLFELCRPVREYENEEKKLKQIEDARELRDVLLQSNSITFVLGILSELADIFPRDPEHVAFKDKVELMKSKQAEKKKTQQGGSDGKYWAKGTGYSTTADDGQSQGWTHETYVQEQNKISKRLAQIVEGLTKYLAILPLPEDYPFEGKPSRTPQPPLSSEIYSILSASCLFPLIESYLRNDSLLVMIRQFDLYVKLLELIRVIAGHDELVVFLDSTPGKSDSVSELVQRASNFASKSIPNTTKITKLKSSQPAKKKLTKTHIQEVEEEEIALARDLFITRDIVSSSLEQVKAKKLKDSEQSQKKEMPTPADDTTEFAVKYKEALADEQFGEYNMLDSSGSSYKHHYNEKIQSDSGTNPAKMKRLRQEIQTLYSSLPLYPNSSIFLRFDESRMDILQCVITGPVDTPYENGCFLFDIYCPSDYPSSSPLMNLETTGNGSVRFNPNLYNCGKVCLSLLGTWRGGPNEKWNEKTSTLLQVFVSIQSLIFVEKPYFNEPGYENSMNTPEGDSQNRKYNEVIRVATLQWAIIDQISNPSKGFEKAITTHFLLKRNDIMRQCYAWIKDARKDNSKAHLTTLQKLTEEVKVLLQSLDPSTPLIIPQDEEEKIQKKVNSELEKQRWLMALSVLDLVPGYPIGLCVKALEINKDVLDNSVNWLLEQGESYIFDHPEVFSLVNPLEDPKD